MRTVPMVDVSFWQESNRAYPPVRPMDWSKAKEQGIEGAYIKASEGVSSDPAMLNHHTLAGEQNIKRGAYHFYRDYVSGADQGIQFLATIVGRVWELPPAIDLEVACDSKQVWDLAGYIHTHLGIWPLLYTNPNVWNNKVTDSKVWVGLQRVSCKQLLAENCGLWQAQYPYAEYDNGLNIVPLSDMDYFTNLGKHAIIHQYSVKNALGKQYGSQDSVSIDLDLADPEWFNQFEWPNEPPAPEPTPAGPCLRQDFRCLVTGQNIRNEPTTSSAVIGKLTRGEILSNPTEVAIKNRYEVWFKFQVGWVAAVHGGTQYLDSIQKE